jgi:hypothetical protein
VFGGNPELAVFNPQIDARSIATCPHDANITGSKLGFAPPLRKSRPISAAGE